MTKGQPLQSRLLGTRELEARNEAIRKLARRRPRAHPPHHVGHALQRAAAENA